MDLFQFLRDDALGSPKKGEVNMKYTTVIALLVLTLSLAGAAQLPSNKLVTNVPFDFIAWNKTVPAGECVVQRISGNASVVNIRNQAAGPGTLAMLIQDRETKATGKYSLVFHKYGTRHFLSQIRTASGAVYKVPESKLEREMLAQNAAPQEEILLASAK
jgi:hypothetical protein